jgi:hypothetical protein
LISKSVKTFHQTFGKEKTLAITYHILERIVSSVKYGITLGGVDVRIKFSNEIGARLGFTYNLPQS